MSHYPVNCSAETRFVAADCWWLGSSVERSSRKIGLHETWRQPRVCSLNFLIAAKGFGMTLASTRTSLSDLLYSLIRKLWPDTQCYLRQNV